MIKRAKELRAEARESLSGNWLIAVLAGLMAAILGATSGFSFSFSFGSSNSGVENADGATAQEIITEAFEQLPDGMGTIFIAAVAAIFSFAAIVSLVYMFIGPAAAIGYNRFNIDMVNGQGANFTTIFSGFKIFFKAFGLSLFMGLFTFLWALLFFIPGIIAAFRYSMAPYIMAENPNIGIREAVNMSKQMMKGYKWRYFCLGLSFIGWAILCVFTCGIGVLWLNPYIYAANAAFYRMVSANYNAQQTNANVPYIPQSVN